MAREEELVSRTCPICETPYLATPARLRWGRQTTCSRTCSYILRSREKERQVGLVCAFCRKKFSRTASQIKGKHGSNFCSPFCHYSGRSTGLTKRVVTRPYRITDVSRRGWAVGYPKIVAKRRLGDNYVKSEATRAKLSEAAARTLAKMRPGFSSKLEDDVASKLKELGVPHVRQYVIRDPRGRFSAVLDFWLPDVGGAIEVNGTFWHADRRVYPTVTISLQKRAVEKYTRKLELLRTLGLPVAEVWEMDLKKEPRQAVLNAYEKLSRR